MKMLKYIYTNSIIVALFYCIIALIFYYVFYSVNIFFSTLSIGISCLLLITATQQNRIKKNNIKLSKFDKRYVVYEVIADSLVVIGRKNYSTYILSDNITSFFINQLKNVPILNLEKQTLLSRSLFDEGLYAKNKSINYDFDKIKELHFASYKHNIKFRKSLLFQFAEFDMLFAKIVLGMTTKKYVIINSIKKFFDIYKNILGFNTAVAYYPRFIKESGIMKDFNDYLMLSKLNR